MQAVVSKKNISPQNLRWIVPARNLSSGSNSRLILVLCKSRKPGSCEVHFNCMYHILSFGWSPDGTWVGASTSNQTSRLSPMLSKKNISPQNLRWIVPARNLSSGSNSRLILVLCKSRKPGSCEVHFNCMYHILSFGWSPDGTWVGASTSNQTSRLSPMPCTLKRDRAIFK